MAEPSDADLDQDVPGIEDNLLRCENKTCLVISWVVTHFAVLLQVVVGVCLLALSQQNVFADSVKQTIVKVVTVCHLLASSIGYIKNIIAKTIRKIRKRRKELWLAAHREQEV